jgi:hypothetical protein
LLSACCSAVVPPSGWPDAVAVRPKRPKQFVRQ